MALWAGDPRTLFNFLLKRSLHVYITFHYGWRASDGWTKSFTTPEISYLKPFLARPCLCLQSSMALGTTWKPPRSSDMRWEHGYSYHVLPFYYPQILPFLVVDSMAALHHMSINWCQISHASRESRSLIRTGPYLHEEVNGKLSSPPPRLPPGFSACLTGPIKRLSKVPWPHRVQCDWIR